ncbi:hypothetical protein AB0L40_24660 [Patulibacter sp. NPDC049589]|uniref:hypothetical protein n=1 Tax=Patulibacter sp. NPDC049589 TaxID=3154731 RepID=UPI00342BE098
MQLALLQPLAPILAGGVVLYGVGSVRPEGPLRRARPVGRVVVLGALVVGAVVGLFLAFGVLLDTHPAQTPLAVMALFGLGIALYLALDRHRPPPLPLETQRDDDEGGGGQRRPRPTPPPGPVGPPAPPAPWQEFDDIRAGWERVPAGNR